MYGYIYKTINLTNNKIYIGQHKSTYFDNKYLGSGLKLINAINKHGKYYFSKVLLKECFSKQELDEAEKYYIALYKSTDDNIGYNIALGGSGVPLAEFSEEHKRKISKSKKGIHFNDETRLKMSIDRKGSKWINNGKENKLIRRNQLNEYLYEGSEWTTGIFKREPKKFYREETKIKISRSLTGKKKSPSAIQKHKNSLINKHRHWYTNGNKNLLIPEGEEIPFGFYRGKYVSEEFKQKVSNSCKGRIPWNKGIHK